MRLIKHYCNIFNKWFIECRWMFIILYIGTNITDHIVFYFHAATYQSKSKLHGSAYLLSRPVTGAFLTAYTLLCYDPVSQLCIVSQSTGRSTGSLIDSVLLKRRRTDCSNPTFLASFHIIQHVQRRDVSQATVHRCDGFNNTIYFILAQAAASAAGSIYTLLNNWTLAVCQSMHARMYTKLD
jgi:hypothetical protein